MEDRMTYDLREVKLTARALLANPPSALYLEFKTFEFFRATLRRMVTTLYNGWIGGEFVETMSNLITGQLIQAHIQAWMDEVGEGDPPAFLQLNAQRMVDEQIGMIQPFYVAVLDARIDGTSISPLLTRVDMWANRWNEAYDAAVGAITAENGGKMEWVLGATEKHCPFCSGYNGIVAFATEWDIAGVKPQNAPNLALSGVRNGEKGCEGWQCDCERRPTTKRRTRNALQKILSVKAGA